MSKLPYLVAEISPAQDRRRRCRSARAARTTDSLKAPISAWVWTMGK